MADNKQSTQFRFLLAATLSLLVLFGWSYFFPSKKPIDQANTNTAQVSNANTNAPVPESQPTQTVQTPVVAATTDDAPNKTITIKTPLYQVKLDSKGAVATSWIIFKNKSSKGEKMLYADGSTETDKKPLELVSPEGLNQNPRQVPFRLSTGDQNIDNFINERNYSVSVNEENIELAEGQSKPVDFVLRDEANGLEVTKSFVFNADSYVSDLKLKLTRNNQIIPNARLLIGASIGDHGIKHHNYYHIEPEAVAYVNGHIERHPAASVVPSDKTEANLAVNGEMDWAGIGDAYFAMAAIPAQKASGGLEYRATKYEVETEPFYSGIFSWITRQATTKETRHLLTAYVPINTDGSTNKIYTGTKDYFVLSAYNDILTKDVGRPIDIEDFINFSNWTFFRPIFKTLAVPILYALTFLNNLIGNYGWAIIIFTFFFYSLLFPMRWYQSKSFKGASANAPKMKELQDKLKDYQKKGIPADDPRMRELQMEQLRMMKTAVPLGGCLPMLLQFPLLIALYTAVTIAIGFRQAPFLYLPDLSAGDPWHILEFGFALSMILSMKFTPQAAAATPEQQMQQKMMTYLMPVMMLWIMWSAPAGLLLYWFFGNIVSFAQQLIINRLNKTPEPPSSEIVQDIPKGVKKIKPKLSTS